ncbi:MAG: VWA domain-containing protein [Terriglobales bacterium]|jgi:VWFA-related protein|nr:VWA domain-containing protein [Terriglobales bacterium]
MFSKLQSQAYGCVRKYCLFIFLWLLGLFLIPGVLEQASAQTNQSSPNPTTTQQKQDAPPDAGGPQNETGPYAIPKKPEEPPAPPPEKPKKVEGIPDYSIHLDVPIVNVDALVTTKDGQFIPNLKQENFRVFEDGVPQTISNFTVSKAPITAVMLIEFASTDYGFLIDALQASYSFADTLKKDDWVAVVYYDMKPHTLVDFTQDKGEVMGALNQLRIPGFAETNLFDALYDTLDRMDRIEGHKYIILISSGFDSFSKLNLNQITKKVKTTKDVTIFAISIGWLEREYFESHGGAAPHGAGIPITEIDYLQADNEMQTFARLTGGRFYQPRFVGDMVDAFRDVSGDIRNEYAISYKPTNTKLDGTYRKLRVDVVAPDGGPLKIRDQKGKDVKYQVIAREGYTAKHTVE